MAKISHTLGSLQQVEEKYVLQLRNRDCQINKASGTNWFIWLYCHWRSIWHPPTHHLLSFSVLLTGFQLRGVQAHMGFSPIWHPPTRHLLSFSANGVSTEGCSGTHGVLPPCGTRQPVSRKGVGINDLYSCLFWNFCSRTKMIEQDHPWPKSVTHRLPFKFIAESLIQNWWQKWLNKIIHGQNQSHIEFPSTSGREVRPPVQKQRLWNQQSIWDKLIHLTLLPLKVHLAHANPSPSFLFC
jgi:hypothetical protein